MKITQESLKAHDYKKKMRALSHKSDVIKKKSKELYAQISDTLKQCNELLHPQQCKKD